MGMRETRASQLVPVKTAAAEPPFSFFTALMSITHLYRSTSKCAIYANVFQYKACREIGGTRCSDHLLRSYVGPFIDRYGIEGAQASFKLRNYMIYEGYSFPTSLLQSLPKIFSCCWLDNYSIALGCKDGSVRQVYVADISKSPWIIRCLSEGVHNNAGDWATGARGMRQNQDLGLLASSVYEGSMIKVWDANTLTECCKLSGAHGNIYDIDWINETTLLSVGQKSEYCAWRLSLDSLETKEAQPIHRLTGSTNEKYRCVRSLSPLYKFMVLSLSNNCYLFDSNTFKLVYGFRCASWKGSRCASWSIEHTACLIGGQNSISVFDPRDPGLRHLFEFSEHQGIRSISSRGHRITFTTGSGKIAFSDFRMASLLSIPDESCTHPEGPHTWIYRTNSCYQVLGGHIEPTPFYNDRFSPHPIEQAVFTHAYDPSGVRLFVGGGPSMELIQGCTAGILF